MIYSLQNGVRGSLIYGGGDTVAALISGEFMLSRMFGMMVIGATVYAVEIPNYFLWIDRRSAVGNAWLVAGRRALLALAYFNPLWIARHLLFIKLFSCQWGTINLQLLLTSIYAFLLNIPLAFVANYLIQNKITYDWRFVASASFSAMMAIYYALSEVWFGSR